MSDKERDEQTRSEPPLFVSEFDVECDNGHPKSVEDAVERCLTKAVIYANSGEQYEVITTAMVAMMGRLVRQLHLCGKFNATDVAAVLGGDFRQATPEEVAAYATSRHGGQGDR